MIASRSGPVTAGTTAAIFASAFHPHVGGVEELVRQLALEQRQRGSRTLVLTNQWPRGLARKDVVDGIPVIREPMRFPGPSWRHWAGFGLDSERVVRRLRAAVQDAGVDVVHVQCVSNNGYYALRVAKSLRLPLVVTMQGELSMDAEQIYQRNAAMRYSWRKLLDHADVITACSHHSLSEAEQVYGRPFGERARVVYNGIRLSEFSGLRPERRARPYVLGLGRMVHQKGMDLLIEAYARLHDHHDVDLVLAGDGAARPELEQLVDRLRLRDRVTFLGSVDHQRALQLFAGAEAFVLGSRHEPQGIVLLEAMAAGAPVVAAAVGGVPEVVSHGINGLLFTGGDAEGLARELAKVLQDPSLRAALNAAGMAQAARFDWQRIADAYTDCYRRATPQC